MKQSNNTLKDFWKEAKNKNKSYMKEKDYTTIALAAAISTIVGFFANSIDWVGQRITGIFFVDVIIIILVLSVGITTFIRIILWLGDFLNKLTTFFKLVWTGWILKYDTTTNKQT